MLKIRATARLPTIEGKKEEYKYRYIREEEKGPFFHRGGRAGVEVGGRKGEGGSVRVLGRAKNLKARKHGEKSGPDAEAVDEPLFLLVKRTFCCKKGSFFNEGPLWSSGAGKTKRTTARGGGGGGETVILQMTNSCQSQKNGKQRESRDGVLKGNGKTLRRRGGEKRPSIGEAKAGEKKEDVPNGERRGGEEKLCAMGKVFCCNEGLP